MPFCALKTHLGCPVPQSPLGDEQAEQLCLVLCQTLVAHLLVPEQVLHTWNGCSTFARTLAFNCSACAAIFMADDHDAAHVSAEQRYDNELQQTELDYLLSSDRAKGALAENYIGLPF